MFAKITQYLNKLNPYYTMSRMEQVASVVPKHTVYVTVGAAFVLDKAATMGKPTFSTDGLRQALSDYENLTSVDAYLAHDGNSLYVIESKGIYIQTPIKNVHTVATLSKLSTIRFLNRGGFCIFLKDGRSIILSTQMPVQTTTPETYASIGKASDTTGGWAAELSQYGVETVYGTS